MAGLADRVRAKERAAIGAAGAAGAAATDAVADLTRDADPEVRELALYCVGEAGGPRAGALLAAGLADPFPGAAGAALAGIRRHAQAALAPELALAWDATSHLVIRRGIALVLGGLEGWDLAALRTRRDAERDPETKELALVALARAGDPAARAQFAALLREHGEHEGKRLVLHAEYIRQPWLLKPLTGLLDDWSPAQRLVEGPPGPPYLRVCDLAVDLVADLAGRRFGGAPRPLTNYDLSVMGEVRAFLEALP